MWLLFFSPSSHAQDIQAIESATWTHGRKSELVALPHVFHADQVRPSNASSAYTFEVVLASIPERPVALYAQRVSQYGVLTVNGQWVGPCLEGSPAITLCGNNPSSFRVPLSFLHAGTNQFSIELTPAVSVPSGLSILHFGDAEKITKEQLEPQWFGQTVPLEIITWVMMATSIFGLMVGAALRSPEFLFLSTAGVLHAAYRFGTIATHITIPAWLYDHLVFPSKIVAIYLFTLGIICLFGKRTKKITYFVLAIPVFTVVLWWSLGVGSSWAPVLQIPGVLTVAVLMVACIYWSWKSKRLIERLLAGSAVLVTGAGVVDALILKGYIPIEYRYLIYYVNLSFFVIIASALFNLAYGRLRDSLFAKERLEEKLKEKESELKETFSALVQLQTEAARTQERERITQDLHDGMGSSLSSARLALESGKMDRLEIAEVLSDCIDDLRLVLDASGLDACSLVHAIGGFRYRMNRRLSSTGRSIRWSVNVPSHIDLGQTRTLHVMRFVQEATINALRHSASDEVRLSIQTDLEKGELIIQVSNDTPGVAAPPSNLQGRGLHNMHKRAELAGGTLTLNRTPDLVECILRLPLLPADCNSQEH